MTNSSAVIGIAEVALNVRDLARMRQFYQDVLGFRLMSQACYESGPNPDPNGEPTIAFLITGQADTPLGRQGQSQLLALIDFERHIFVRGRFDGHDHRRSTLNHLAFEISPESYETEKARLETLGISPRSILFPEMSARSLFFADPEENVLELICHAPARSEGE